MSKRRESKAGRQRRVRSKRRADLSVVDGVVRYASPGFRDEELVVRAISIALGQGYRDTLAVREVVTIRPPLGRDEDWDAYARQVVAENEEITEATVIMADMMSVRKRVRP